jgi:hypothetical protein
MWIIDPKTKEASVSLTILMVSFVVCVVSSGLEMAGVIKSTSMSFEMFGAASGLYFGRRWGSAKGQSIDGESK